MHNWEFMSLNDEAVARGAVPVRLQRAYDRAVTSKSLTELDRVWKQIRAFAPGDVFRRPTKATTPSVQNRAAVNTPHYDILPGSNGRRVHVPITPKPPVNKVADGFTACDIPVNGRMVRIGWNAQERVVSVAGVHVGFDQLPREIAREFEAAAGGYSAAQAMHDQQLVAAARERIVAAVSAIALSGVYRDKAISCLTFKETRTNV